MKRERTQHIIGILGCIPLIYVVVEFFVEDPRHFNPMAKDEGWGFWNLWFIALPVLIGTAVCLVNSIIGLVLSRRK